jgi:HK97 family phage major capsid protein
VAEWPDVRSTISVQGLNEMPTVEELVAETKKTVAERDSVKAELKSLKDKLSSTVDPSLIHRDASGASAGGWEESDDELTAVVGRDDLRGVPKLERRSSAKSVIKSLVKQGYKPYGEFKSFGEFIKFGVENRDYKNKIETRVGDHFKSVSKAIQGMTTTDGSDGGFAVMPEFSKNILERSFDNNLWNETDSYTVSGNSMTFLASAEISRANGSRHGGLQGFWQGEGGAGTKSKPTIREVNLKLGKIIIIVYLTNELLADNAYALEQYVTRKAGDEIKFLQGDSLINGISSGGQPMGWINSPNLVSVAKEVGQDAKTIQTINVENMYSRFFAPMLPKAKWYHHQDIQPQLDTMTLGLGLGQVPVYLPPGGMSEAPYGMLKGRAMQPTEFNATLGTQGDLMLADMSQMLSISKGGIQQAVSMHVEFLTDQLAMRFTLRCGARPWENTPLTPYKGTNSQSSCIALDSRA